MAKAEPVQFPRGVRIGTSLVSVLILAAIVTISARPLLQPVGTDATHKAIKNTAALPVLMWCLGWPIALARSPDRLSWRLPWSLGCVLLLVHVAVAFHLGHGWSHERAWEHTRQAGGYGDGVYVNYAFALVWCADVVWALASPTSYVTRPRWLNWSIHGFLAFVVFNAAVVFASRQMRISFTTWFLGVAGAIWWLRRRTPDPKPAATELDNK